MHVLTARGGELAAPFGPVCTDDDCTCHHGLAGLDSRCPVELITVAERPDLDLAQLTTACSAFLEGAGWDDDGELAGDMAQLAAEAAAEYPVGTALRVRFDHTEYCWMFSPDPVAA